MAGYNIVTLLPAGSNSNVTGPGKPVPPDSDFLAFRIVCEGAGTAITWVIQGSLDLESTSDANSQWWPIGYVTEASDAVAFTARSGPTTVGGEQICFPSIPARKYRKYRAVISGIAGVVYRVEMAGADVE